MTNPPSGSVASLLLSAVALAAFSSGCAADAPEVDQSPIQSTEAPLVGGTPAGESQFVSSILIREGCTASKVGPRKILTAAHCVHDLANNAVAADYAPGKSITFTKKRSVDDSKSLASQGYRTATIESTVINPTWIAETPNENGDGVVVLGPNTPPDVAVITITPGTASTLADIPAGQVDSRPVRVGDTVSLLGYGCEQGLNGPIDPSIRRLNYDTVQTLPALAVVHLGSYFGLFDPRVANVARSYVVTPGNTRLLFRGASLCYGDSGGPLYRGDGSSNLIVGINSYYTFIDFLDPNGISVTNLHTRLDRDARYGVLSWLRGQGVSIRD